MNINDILAEAAETHTSVLDLKSRELSHIPPEVFRLPSLEELYLGDNRIKELPRDIKQCRSLKVLDCSGNLLSALPDALGHLTSLVSLSLSRNQLALLPRTLGRLLHLTTLDLSANRLTLLDDSIGGLLALRHLDLSHNRLERFPTALSRLRNLQHLLASNNHLTHIPDSIELLHSLLLLDLSSNRLVSIPTEVGSLKRLQRLALSHNALSDLPASIGSLGSLQDLSLDWNQLTALPPSIGSLESLISLNLAHNSLSELPDTLGTLARIDSLDVSYNSLRRIPPSLAALPRGTQPDSTPSSDESSTPLDITDGPWYPALRFQGNPLPQPFFTTAERGPSSFFAFLKSLMAGGTILFETKVMLVGEGQVGKSSLKDCLLGRTFVENRPTTHGIEIAHLDVPHPQSNDIITLNLWDFGGQPVYRVTHQFFFSPRSLYVLAWSPRMDVEQCDVEGWIRRIQLRVGDAARILVVATHCETGERIARIDGDRLARTYGHIIGGCYEVDSKTGSGVDELKRHLAKAAADLPQMGYAMAKSWLDTRDQVLAFRMLPRLPYEKLLHIATDNGLAAHDARVLADLLHDLGHIVYYGDEEELEEEVILQPEWLTKAIGYILEDKVTLQASGVLDHRRLREIWFDHGVEGRSRYEPPLHTFFLRLMEKYDVSYRLEGGSHSLVGQLVPQVQPRLPWIPQLHNMALPATCRLPETPALDLLADGTVCDAIVVERKTLHDREVMLICTMNELPPGLIPWMIVRTRHFAVQGLHWAKGMFLSYGEHGQAVIELIDRPPQLYITVRASWPNYFMGILRFTLERLIADRWPGLEYSLSVPCRRTLHNGQVCKGRFLLNSLTIRARKTKRTVDCPECDSEHNVSGLLSVFEPPAIIEQLDVQSRIYKGHASEAAARYSFVMRAISAANRECPRLFVLGVETLSEAVLKSGRPITCEARLWCEFPGGQHQVGSTVGREYGVYRFKHSVAWLTELAPYTCAMGKLLHAVLAPDEGARASGSGQEIAQPGVQDVREMVHLMRRLLVEPEAGDFRGVVGLEGLLTREQEGGLKAFNKALMRLDGRRTWGGLRRVLTPTGDYYWLCPNHYAQFEPGPPTAEEVAGSVGERA